MSNSHLMRAFLRKDHHQRYYVHVAHELKSVEAAILLEEFIQREEYHRSKGELITILSKGEGWFYYTRELIEERTAIGRRQQDNAIEILKKYGLIEIEKYGLPCKRYFRISDNGLEKLSKKLSSLYTVSKLAGTQCTNSFEHSEQTVPYIEETHKELKKEEREEAAPPTPPPSSKKKKSAKIPSEPKTAYREKVLLTEKEHRSLREKYGYSQEKFDWMLDHLDAKKGAKGYEYESDYHVLLPSNWVHEAYEKAHKSANGSTPSQAVENSKLAEKIWNKFKGRPQMDISLSHNYLEFINGVNSPSVCLEFDRKDFKEKVAEQLRMRNLRLN